MFSLQKLAPDAFEEMMNSQALSEIRCDKRVSQKLHIAPRTRLFQITDGVSLKLFLRDPHPKELKLSFSN